jgi:hypothetical protein
MELGSFKEGVALLRTARAHDVRDHSLICRAASCELVELEPGDLQLLFAAGDRW